MRYSILGYRQRYAATLRKKICVNGRKEEMKIDCTDLVILHWFIDFYFDMEKMEVDGKEYALVRYDQLIDALPILDMSKSECSDRMQKLVEFGLLEHRTFSLYRRGENYHNMVNMEEMEK